METSKDTRYYNTSLTADEQMFIFRWYPIMGSIWVSNELGVELHLVLSFAKEMRIPKSKIEPDMTAKEIANKMGLTEAEVNIILRSAMTKMKRYIKDKKLEDFSIEW